MSYAECNGKPWPACLIHNLIIMIQLLTSSPRSPLLLILALGLGLAACTGPRYASSTEYDDVYFSSSDETQPLAANDDRDDRRDPYRYGERRPVDSYHDSYYEDDDFVFSRRLRRFHQPASRSFRYYDPFYSNDLYYVMGTPAWNRWNHQYGWYNWNNPRFASPFRPMGPSWRFNMAFNQPAWGWNSWNTGYYNPYVASYYGNDPFFGNNFGWNNGLGYGGLGAPGGYYCPPNAYVRGPGAMVIGGNGNGNNSPQPVTRRRNQALSPRSQTTLRSRQASGNATRTPNQAVSSQSDSRTRAQQEYLRPRQPVRQASSEEVQRTVRESRTRMQAQPSRNSRYQSSPRTSPNRNSPSLNRSRTQPRTSPSRNTSSPRRSNVAPRTRPSNNNRGSNFSSPSRNRNSGSNSRPRSGGNNGSSRRRNP